MFMKLSKQIGLGLILLSILAACGGAASATPENLSDPTAAPAPTATIETLPVGHQLFITKGCAACHGQAVEGSAIAPALGGHSGNQVRRQVRAPLGLMPIFPPSNISNEELAEIAEFIESLSGEHAHQAPAAKADASAQHHWMALFALEDGQSSEAAHHINHVIGLVEGEHLARMQEAIQAMESENLHDAEHIIESMIAGTAAPDVTGPEMHLRLAASSSVVENIEDAIHHLEHYAELVDSGSPESAIAHRAMELLAGGDLSDAEHEISALLGEENEEHSGAGEADEHADEHADGDAGEADEHGDENADGDAGEADDPGDEHADGSAGEADEHGDEHEE